MRKICWLLVMAVSLSVARPAPFDAGDPAGRHPLQNLVFDSRVADNLALLFSQFDTELVLCLEGERRGPDLRITDFRMPHILLSETGRVQAAGCRSDSRTVGTWHNHPPVGVSLASSNPQALTRNCYLSRTDIHDFVRRSDALVTVVSCAPHTYAFWTRDDVGSGTGDVALLPPPAGQLIRGEATTGPEATALTQARRR